VCAPDEPGAATQALADSNSLGTLLGHFVTELAGIGRNDSEGVSVRRRQDSVGLGTLLKQLGKLPFLRDATAADPGDLRC